MLKRLIAVFAVLTIAIAGNAQVVVYAISDLPPLPGDLEAYAYAVNVNGVVVGASVAQVGNNYEHHACLWSRGTVSYLGTIAGYAQSDALGINDFGQICGTVNDYKTNRGVTWTGGVLSQLGTLPGGTFSDGAGINNAGQIVGTSNGTGFQNHGFVWQNGNLTDLGVLPAASFSVARAINIAGQVAGYSGSVGANYWHAVLWNGTSKLDLGVLTGATTGSEGISINSGGQVAGLSDQSQGFIRGFLWQGGQLIDIGTLGGDRSWPNAMNDAGQIVGWSDSTYAGSIPFLWQNGKMRDLSLLLPATSTWTLFDANGINNRGQIVGWGWNGTAYHAYIMTPVGTLLPDRAGNAGKTSIQVVYPGMTAGTGTTATLQMSGQPDIVGQQPRVFEDDSFKTSVLHVSFDLTNAKPGKWTLVINTPNVPTITLKNVFTVEEARNPAIGVEVTGRNLARNGFPTIYQVVVSNSGNFDAVNVPVWIATTDTGADIVPEFPILTPPAISGLSTNWGNYPQAIKTSTQKMLPVIIPRVPPGGTVALSFRVKFSSLADFQVGAWTSPLYRQLLPGLSTNPVRESLKEIGRQVFALATGDPLLDPTDSDLGNAASKAVDQFGAVRDNAYKNSLILDSMSSLTWMLEQEVLLLASYKNRSLPDGAFKSAIATVFGQLGTYAPKSFSTEGFLKQIVKVSDSDDPNHATGPVSAVPDVPGNWVGGDNALGFAVNFENKPTANYPTQAVTVIDQLDPVALDLSTLSLGPISVPGGKARPVSGISPVSTSGDGSPSSGDYTADISLAASPTRPHALYLHIRAYLDAATSRLVWQFTSTRQDGQTMAPEDGFLAPGDEGSVTFQVYSNRTNPTYTTENYARVFFDQDQTGIETNHWANTIDAAKPVSAVGPLAAKRTNPNIALSWTGSDVGVSTTPRDYTLFVRDWADGTAFLPYIEHTVSKSVDFTGVGGHTYSFLTVATDWTGNTELITGVDATTTVTLAPWLLTLTPNPVPGSQTVTGTVAINAPAPANGAVVSLTNKNTAAKFSNGTDAMNITIPAGAMTSPPFTMTTVGVATNVTGSVGAKYAGVTKTTGLTVRPVHVQSVTLSPVQPVGGQVSTGTVTLECLATPGPIDVTLTSSNTSVATVSTSKITIPVGSSSGTFSVISKPVSTKTPVTITATANGYDKTAALTVKPPTPVSVTFNPPSVKGGTSSTATVTLSGKAPTGGVTVALKSSTPNAIVPASLTVPATVATKTFTVTTKPVTSNMTATISATANGVTKSGKLTITP